MDRWRAIVALNVAGRRVEPGEIFDGHVDNLADAVRLRLVEPAPAAAKRGASGGNVGAATRAATSKPRR